MQNTKSNMVNVSKGILICAFCYFQVSEINRYTYLIFFLTQYKY